MIDDQLVLKIERLRDEVEAFGVRLKDSYSSKNTSVTNSKLKKQAAALAERWLVEVASRQDISDVVGKSVAEKNIHFQRLLTCSERSTIRKKYDESVRNILKDFNGSIVVPLKANRFQSARSQQQPAATALAENQANPTFKSAKVAFIGQSFLPADAEVNQKVHDLLVAIGLDVVTGEKPRAESVSKKVRMRIDRSDIFVGIFTKREKLEGKQEWTTSTWVIDEKAYALAGGKKLILLTEKGVKSIGGLQGDYEYFEFERDKLADLLIKICEAFFSDG